MREFERSNDQICASKYGLSASKSLRSPRIWINAVARNTSVEILGDGRPKVGGIYSVIPIANWLSIHPPGSIAHDHRSAA